MSKKLCWFFLFILLSTPALAQVLPYTIFDSLGEKISFEVLVEKAESHEVLFFGEQHDNSIVHWLQLQVLKALQEKQKDLILAGEFFERDDQVNIDEWFAGKITDKNFEAEAKLWNNYLQDYKPLLLYAKSNDIPFVASNIPRKYASLVSREGLEALSELSVEAKKHIAQLPVELDIGLPGYASMRDMMHGSGMNPDFMIAAQAIKDATMAESIRPHLGLSKTILHINGAYHSNNKEGIVWYLLSKAPETQILTISTVEQDDIHILEAESRELADIIIVVPTDSHKSY